MQRISYQGFDNNYATFAAGDNVKHDYPMKIDENGKITACNDGDAFIGICENTRGGYVTVQLQGYAELPFSGDSINYGYQKLVSDGEEGVRSGEPADTAPYVKVVKISDDKATVGFIF